MDARCWTMLVMAVAVGLMIGWDVYVAFFNRIPNRVDTISGIMLGWAQQIWTLPFAFGVLGGHLFWPALAGPVFGAVWSIPVLLALAILIGVTGWWYRRKNIGWVAQGPLLVITGVLLGHWLWPQ